jgi:hypothetical protein
MKSVSVLPERKVAPKLIVVAAFDHDEEGDLQAVYGPAEAISEDRAIRTAKTLAAKHAGAIAWSREASPAIGEYGPPKTLYVHGEVPDME